MVIPAPYISCVCVLLAGMSKTFLKTVQRPHVKYTKYTAGISILGQEQAQWLDFVVLPVESPEKSLYVRNLAARPAWLHPPGFGWMTPPVQCPPRIPPVTSMGCPRMIMTCYNMLQ